MCVWVEDADNLEITSTELGVLYTNQAIDAYFDPKSKMLGIAGVKGQGKHFLSKLNARE